MADELNGIEDLEDRIYLEMVSWALRSSIDGRRRALRDGLRRAHAAGYARAERDVVAFITSAIDHDDKRVKAATQRGDGARANVYAAGHTALSLTRKRIEDHCHRGAAKDEAPRGEEDNDLLAAYSAAVDEADRLRRLFDDAGEGQFNVLNLVESYQRNSMEADERLRAVRKLLEENGCECPCDHHPDERGPDCEVCLACRIGEAVGK